MSKLTTHYRLARKVSILGNSQGFSVKTLAEKSDLSNSTIYGILHQNRNPRLDTLEKLAKAFKMPIGDFMNLRLDAKSVAAAKAHA